ncbi:MULTISPECIES: porin [Paraburkholderia]|uniref:Porin n=1 Tax=Paraburkholderia madseniana TaxID=2599607 RepID=A0AAP5ESK6_9BURK|nr:MULTISPECIES: porin [Paraburkholderia]MCX4151550.1 porin [Paraburkholderia madseniana]MDN7154481.1 porin [Paraburkholderia sp. WS6]MDQ6413363.1 porin [Paraburkholderia madseniana]
MKSNYTAQTIRNLLAVCLGGGVSVAVHAQSSITLYGILDSGVEYVSHAAKQGSASLFRVNSGNRINSRWGMTGKEDLGGGLRSIFTLESGIATNNGTLQQGGRLFGRQAFVGLETDRFGSVMAGRQITPMYRYFLALDPLNYSSYGLAAQDAQFVGRADNALAYLGHAGPFELNALYSFGYDSTVSNGGEVPGAFRVGKQYDFGSRFRQGAFNLTLVYEQRQGQSIASASDSERRYVAGGSWQIGDATLYGGYELLLNNISATLQASPPQYIAFGGMRYKVTPRLQISAASYYHSYRAVSAHALSSGVNADYWFSKRTALYTDVTYVINSSKSALSATGSTTPVATGANQLAIALGIVHTF